MSKRKLRKLVEEGYVDGWTDPRMPTLAAMRRRGYPPQAIRKFIELIGVAKNDSFVEVELLEHVVRDELNLIAPRRMAILKPLKLIIDNYPKGETEEFEVRTSRRILGMTRGVQCHGRELWIEQDDFMEEPASYFRLTPDGKRLMNAYFVTAHSVEKDEEGTWLPCTARMTRKRGGNALDGRKVKGTIHWVSAGMRSTRRRACMITCLRTTSQKTCLRVKCLRIMSAPTV